MKKFLALVLFFLISFTTIFALSAGAETETLQGTAEGYGGIVSVEVIIEDGEIISVEAEGPEETEDIGTEALEKIPQRIEEANSTDVDSVSGATVTSEAVKEAVNSVLNPEKNVTPKDETSNTTAKDSAEDTAKDSEKDYEDGRYRGSFFDSGDYEIALQFYLEDNIVKDPSFRYLYYDGVDYLKATYFKSVKQVTDQHKEALKYLEGKDITEHLDDLYNPGEIIVESEESIDGFSGATIKGSKIRSAIQDALNRGRYDK